MIALSETFRLPWHEFLEYFSLFPLVIAVWGRLFHAANLFLAPLIGIQVFIVIAGIWCCRRRFLLLSVGFIGSAITVLMVYRLLTTYEPFAGYPPFIAGLGGFAVGMTSCIYATLSVEMEGGTAHMFRLIVGSAALLVAGIMLGIHHTMFQGYYPTLHLTLIALGFIAMLWGGYTLASLLSSSIVEASRRLAVLAVVSALVMITAILGARISIPSDIEPYLPAMSELKQNISSTGEDYYGGQPLIIRCQERDDELSSSEALELFFEYSGYPVLDEKLPLEQMNLLFIMIEATRFDETSLAANHVRDLTPNIGKLKRDGAYNFVRAQAPSSGTHQTTGAILNMTYPSFTPMTIRNPHWQGKLHNRAVTVPERFAEMGHETFRVVHPVLERNRSGYGQGFGTDLEIEKAPGEREFSEVDEQITDKTLSQLELLRDDDRPFFGWLFYWSPHAPYVHRDERDEREVPSARRRYRQEIRHADRQVGRVLDRLDELDLLDKTIVVITSDHGEEFGEHRAHGHNRNLHGTSVHVPLVVRLPSKRGVTIDEPTSLSFLFTWLLLHAEGEVRARTVDHVRETVAPAIRASDGYVVSELLKQSGTIVSLMNGEEKIIFDTASGRIQFFDLVSDPDEQNNIVLSASKRVQEGRARVQRYLAFRACNREFEWGK